MDSWWRRRQEPRPSREQVPYTRGPDQKKKGSLCRPRTTLEFGPKRFHCEIEVKAETGESPTRCLTISRRRLDSARQAAAGGGRRPTQAPSCARRAPDTRQRTTSPARLRCHPVPSPPLFSASVPLLPSLASTATHL